MSRSGGASARACDLIQQDVSDANARGFAATKGVLQFTSKASLRDANALLAAYKELH
ncbi:unnamed protein product [Ectocarpus fasciculatus]